MCVAWLSPYETGQFLSSWSKHIFDVQLLRNRNSAVGPDSLFDRFLTFGLPEGRESQKCVWLAVVILKKNCKIKKWRIFSLLVSNFHSCSNHTEPSNYNFLTFSVKIVNYWFLGLFVLIYHVDWHWLNVNIRGGHLTFKYDSPTMAKKPQLIDCFPTTILLRYRKGRNIPEWLLAVSTKHSKNHNRCDKKYCVGSYQL